MKEKKKQIISQNNLLPENVLSVDASNAGSFSLSDALSYCSTISLFGDRRAVIIDSPYFLKASRSKGTAATKKNAKTNNNADLIEQYCKAPSDSSDLILYCYDFDADKRTKEYKILSSYFGKSVTPIHFGQLSPQELNRHIDVTLQKNHIHLTREAHQELLDRIGGNTTQFYTAMDKILLYGSKELDLTDIEHLVSVNPEINVWKFTDAFLKGDANAIMRSLDELITIERMSYQGIIPLLSYRIKAVYHAVRLDECGMSIERMRAYTGKYQIDKDLSSSRGMSSRKLLEILNELADLDQNIKTGKTGEKEGFEQILLRRIKQCNQ